MSLVQGGARSEQGKPRPCIPGYEELLTGIPEWVFGQRNETRAEIQRKRGLRTVQILREL